MRGGNVEIGVAGVEEGRYMVARRAGGEVVIRSIEDLCRVA